ncbi:ATP synthase subunit I [Rubrivivax gelatinosus]|nr:ATP synthase subunit I [Rubrivivax gelatinosus]
MATDRKLIANPWQDEDDAADLHPEPLSREQARDLRRRKPQLSPWRVILAQTVVGTVVALLAALITGGAAAGWSALYGAATAVLPGALMARGMTSRFGSMSPGAGAVSFMLWESVKIAVSVVMLLLAPKLVQSLSWPALLVALALCIKTYWVALLWRGR